MVGCHVLMMAVDIDNFTMLSVKGANHRCFIWSSKCEAINYSIIPS